MPLFLSQYCNSGLGSGRLGAAHVSVMTRASAGNVMLSAQRQVYLEDPAALLEISQALPGRRRRRTLRSDGVVLRMAELVERVGLT